MVQELKQYKTADLVLQVSSNIDPLVLDIKEWDRYLDILSNNRAYQKTAIIKSVLFLASGLYTNTIDLVRENWLNPKMVELKNRYQDLNDYESHLQLPHKLSANIDLATGTGKSYVMYGISQILLSLGFVDRVLILCPSITIEEGLLEKFRRMAEDASLLNAIPDGVILKSPSIKTANVTIREGDICIENIHSVYEKTGSSIRDSFVEKGQRTLVLNDESHHIYNSIESKDQTIKKWKDFLLNPEYNFKYILGFTGTAYVKDDYFNDVIYRYSLRQAVDDKMVKMVDYVSKNDDAEDEIKFQEIYDNHLLNKTTYRKVKTLTILVTSDIKNAKLLASELSSFLMEIEHINHEECEEKILTVTSANEHKANLKLLKDVDSKESKVEWIISVSMLTEGWDVKNVFQIVPWEDRAFNSKLLIAQVLGRGLRIPMEYQSPQPKVRVFNHDSWSKNIRGLINEILEIEMRLVSASITKGERKKYHFEIHQISYEKEAIEKESKKQHQEFDYTKGFIELQSQVEESEKETEYTSLTGDIISKNTLIHHYTFTIDEVVNRIYNELKLREWEGNILKLPSGRYSKQNLPPRDALRAVIKASMARVGILGDRVNEKNKLKIESSFNTLLRKSSKTTVYERVAKDPFRISTKNMDLETLAVGNLRHYTTVFHSSDYSKELEKEQLDILQAVIDDDTFPKSASKEINIFLLKTPFNLVFAKYEPERKFIEQLCKSENSQHLDAWIKSRDMNFYSVEYSITSKAGKHSKVQFFNPDFFIKVTKGKIVHLIVLETKFDNDISDENKAKLKYASLHFQKLNEELKQRNISEVYHFHFLSPNSYTVFFDYLKKGQLIEGRFRSDLESKLADEE